MIDSTFVAAIDDLSGARTLQYTHGQGPDARTLYSRAVFNAPRPLEDPQAAPLTLYSLASTVTYLKHNPDALDLPRHLVRVLNPALVCVESPLFGQRQRETLIVTKYLSPLGDFLGSYHNLVDFRVALGSRFASKREDDRDQLLDLLARVKTENSEVADDTGLSQSVTAVKGAVIVQREQVQNPVRLSPFRSFPEAGQQVTSEFVLRLRGEDKPGAVASAALFLADGGAWEATARYFVAEWLRAELGEAEVNIPVYH